MGNRGNVIFVAGERISPCVYLHWNGGPESVYAFLEELDRRHVRADADYEAARFVQVVGEFFSHEVDPTDSLDSSYGLSLGIVSAPLSGISAESLATIHTDPSDNGFYVVNRGDGKVRRFIEDDLKLSELPAVQVIREQTAAAEHSYRAGIREMFAELEGWRVAATNPTCSATTSAAPAQTA